MGQRWKQEGQLELFLQIEVKDYTGLNWDGRVQIIRSGQILDLLKVELSGFAGGSDM